MKFLIVGLLFVSLCSHGQTLAELEPQQTPYETVQETTNVLLLRLAELGPTYEIDPAVFFKEIDRALAPHIDFQSFVKGVMAKHYRTATANQQKLFEQRFREGLVKTYATALVGFDNEKIVVLLPTVPEQVPERATIQIEIYAKSGAIYTVVYQLGLVEGHWLLRNVVINGINIGLQYRSQFNAYMQKYRRDIDAVIENWAVDA
jgi:phospholipid transport system substrate-binding protein